MKHAVADESCACCTTCGRRFDNVGSALERNRVPRCAVCTESVFSRDGSSHSGTTTVLSIKDLEALGCDIKQVMRSVGDGAAAAACDGESGTTGGDTEGIYKKFQTRDVLSRGAVTNLMPNDYNYASPTDVDETEDREREDEEEEEPTHDKSSPRVASSNTRTDKRASAASTSTRQSQRSTKSSPTYEVPQLARAREPLVAGSRESAISSQPSQRSGNSSHTYERPVLGVSQESDYASIGSPDRRSDRRSVATSLDGSGHGAPPPPPRRPTGQAESEAAVGGSARTNRADGGVDVDVDVPDSRLPSISAPTTEEGFRARLSSVRVFATLDRHWPPCNGHTFVH